MNPRAPISDQDLQDLIDDRLDGPARAALAARLLACPGRRAEVQALRRQQEALRQIGHEILYEPVPPRLHRILGRDASQRPARQVRHVGLTSATAAILTGCVAGGFGC